MSTQANKTNNHRFYEEVWNKGYLAVVDELIAADAVLHNPTTIVHGPEGLKQYVAMYRTAFPDIHFTIEDEIAEGEKVVTRWTARGTHHDSLMGIPPTGRLVSMTGIVVSYLDQGLLVESWSNFDALGMLQQLGEIPAPPAQQPAGQMQDLSDEELEQVAGGQNQAGDWGFPHPYDDAP
jgi:steroid delta-isomerase-like uncharacterized protein